MNATVHGVRLSLYVPENRRHEGALLYDWLLRTARELDLPGGSAVRTLAGYGHHGRLHRQDFVELQGEAPVEVVFVASAEQAERLLARIDAAGLGLFWVRSPAEFATPSGPV